MIFNKLLNKTMIIVFVCVSLNLHAQKKRDLIVNRVTAVTETNEDVEEGQKPVKTDFTRFDATGEVVEEIKYKNDGKFDSHFTYEFDSKGNKKKEISFDAKGQKEYSVDIEYDADGNKFRETYTNDKGQKEKIIEYKYNNGLKTDRIVLFPNGKVKSKKKYIYDFQK